MSNVVKERHEILIFGNKDAVDYLNQYLGFTTKSQKGILYYEFPNEKFAHKKFLKLFPYELRIYVARKSLLKTIVSPKQQFKKISSIICIYDNSFNSNTIDECFDYFEKFAKTRKTFVPTLFIGLNKAKNAEKWNIRQFYFNLELRRMASELFGVETQFFNLNVSENEALIFIKARELFESTKKHALREYSTVSIEKMLKTFRKTVNGLNSDMPTNGMKFLAEIEQDKNITLSRLSLIKYFGIPRTNAKAIINYWESRELDIDEEELVFLENESLTRLNKCIQLNLEPNLINLLMLGYDFIESKKSLALLKKMGEIQQISYHSPPEEFAIYANLQDLIIISKGSTLYIRSNDSNHDRTTLFAGLIQTIELVRDNYLNEKSYEMKNLFKIQKVDFLEFGNLHCILGTGDTGIKVILRFKNRPQDLYIKKTRAFMDEFEKVFESILHQKIIDVNYLKPQIDDLFYQYYNPFLQKIPFNKTFSLSEKNIILKKPSDTFSDSENRIINLLNVEKNLTVSRILSKISEESDGQISESDVLQNVFDLIAEKILI